MPIIKYFCRFCNASFGSHADATACERGPMKVNKARSLRVVLGPYPITIEADFPDGTRKTYIDEEAYWQK
jgi:hypothetical protein